MTNLELLNLANEQRRSGRNKEAEILYNQLLSLEPDNIDYLFNKALNNTDTNPNLALDLFEKVIRIDPNLVYTYRNISILSDQTGQHKRGLKILNDFLTINPQNIEVLYEKSALLGNSGDPLNSLLDLYIVLEYCSSNKYPASLSKSQIVQDIALSKTQLRNKTFNTWIKDMSIHNAYRGKKLIEFSYELPQKIFGNENYYFLEGRYNGASIKNVLESDPQFLNDSILDIEYFFVTEEIVELIERKGIDVSRSRPINTVKIQTKESETMLDDLDNDEDDLEDDQPLPF